MVFITIRAFYYKWFLFSLLATIILSFGSYAANPKLIKLLAIDWRPYEGQDLPNGGVATEIVVTAFKTTGYLVELTYMPWSRALKELEVGNYDATVGAYYTEDRSRIYQFSEPYLSSPLVFFKRREDNIPWPGLINLKPYKIGVVRGYANSLEFDAADFLQREQVNSDLANIKKLIARSIDLIVIDKHTGHFLLRRDMVAFANDIVSMTPPLDNRNLYAMFSRNSKNVERKIKDFNDGLNQIIEDKTINRILDKHGLNY